MHFIAFSFQNVLKTKERSKLELSFMFLTIVFFKLFYMLFLIRHYYDCQNGNISLILDLQIKTVIRPCFFKLRKPFIHYLLSLKRCSQTPDGKHYLMDLSTNTLSCLLFRIELRIILVITFNRLLLRLIYLMVPLYPNSNPACLNNQSNESFSL